MDVFSGPPMTAVCDGWYKASNAYFVGAITYDNCKSMAPPPIYQYYGIITDSVVFYDYSLGPITNPPACLLGVSGNAKKITVVKVYPNPVKETLLTKSDKVFNAYEIMEGSGKSLGKHEFKAENINVAKLSAGTYFMKLFSPDEITVMVKFSKN
ncbi:T9SS type A sorting domain-containing protein [Chryseobacterium sp. MP_3.2]|uniref:T9SS type A sorting domain-containing protein n=1 Tax=Chryseobacterium sp. MP_3.2 TaxID=3071712 RepID=UPI002DFCF01B|nr:hypothetical protein [Chryseobacterium sp. MP_3.2]